MSHSIGWTREDSYFVVLNKLAGIGGLNMLEIGFTATPQVIRHMAARGLVKVDVMISQRGIEYLEKEKAKKARRKMKAQKAEIALVRAAGCG